MRRVVLTGGPGAGKTTLLAALSALGHQTVAESAREVIAERVARGESPRPAPAAFAREILRRDMRKYHAAPADADLVFYDRCLLETLALLHEAAPLSEGELDGTLRAHPFHATVFMLPPWPAIYRTDAERDHPFEHAVRVHGDLLRWYTRIGYRVHELPCVGVAERARLVLEVLADDRTGPPREP